MTRLIYNGDVGRIVTVMDEEVEHEDDIKYHDDKVKPVCKKALWYHKRMLLKLKGLQDNLAFTKKDILKAGWKLLKKKCSQKKGKWLVPVEKHKPWVENMEPRVRNMCRHLSQLTMKSPK